MLSLLCLILKQYLSINKRTILFIILYITAILYIVCIVYLVLNDLCQHIVVIFDLFASYIILSKSKTN